MSTHNAADHLDPVAQDIEAMRNAKSLDAVESIARAMKAVGHWTPQASSAYHENRDGWLSRRRCPTCGAELL